jgi:TP901 family phage tail tape measure protein
MALRTVGVRLEANVSGFMAGMKKAGEGTKELTSNLGKAADAGKLDKVSHVMTGMGIGLLGVAAGSVKMAMDFEKAMSQVSAATHAPAGELEQLRRSAIKAGQDTQFSATEAAKGVTELAKAGVSTADILHGGLRGALDLAAAGELSVGEAAETAASALTQFKLKGAQVPHVADLLAAGAGKAQGSVHDMGMALNQSGLVASQFGLSIEDTVGTLAEFAHAGLTGSDAGTSFKTMLLSIANPSKVTAGLMASLGISFYDAQGKFIGVSGAAQMLQTRLKDLTEEQRNQAFGQIFGNDAIRAASILYKDGAEGVKDWRGKVDEAGYAADTAARLTNNLAGDLERLKGSLETVAIQSGGGATGGLRKLAQAANDAVNSFSALPGAAQQGLTLISAAGGVILLGAVAWVKYRKAVADVKTELSSIGPFGERAAGAVGKLSTALGVATGVFVIWQTAMITADALMNKIPANTEAMALGLQKFGAGADLSGNAAAVLGKNLEYLSNGFQFLADKDDGRRQAVKNFQTALEAVTPALRDTSSSLTNTKTQIGAVDAALTSMVQSGNTQGAADAFTRLAKVLAVNGVSMDEFKAMFPQYGAAVEVARSQTVKLSDGLQWVGPNADKARAKIDALGGAAGSAAGGTGDLTSALARGAAGQAKYATDADRAAAAARGEADAISELAAELKGQTDPAYKLISAQAAMRKAQSDYNDALKHNKPNSDAVKEATGKLAEASIALQGAASGAAISLDGKMSPALVTAMKAAGASKGQIEAVSQQLRQAKVDADKYDGAYALDVSAPGAKAAAKDLHDVGRAAGDVSEEFDGKMSPAIGAAMRAAREGTGAFLGLSEAVAVVKTSFAENGRAIEGNSAAARKNRAAVNEAAEAAAHAATVKYRETGSVSKANAVYDDYLGQLRKTLIAAGVNKAGVDKLLGSYAKMPKDVTTRITAPTLKDVTEKVQTLWDKLKGVDGNWVAHLSAKGYGDVKAQLLDLMTAQYKLSHPSASSSEVSDDRREKARMFATGGHVRGPGTGTSDSIPAMLSHGEFVVKAASASKLGPTVLNYINTAGQLPKYAGGGFVYPVDTSTRNTSIMSKADALALVDPFAGMGGSYAGGGALAGWITRGMQLAGAPSNWATPLRVLIMRESGGNPNAINLWDSNAQAGHPSQGLMQTIPSTFNAYALPGLGGITNPIANIVAGIRYIQSRYGSIFNVQQANAGLAPRGYATGGVIDEPVVGVGASGRQYTFAENGPETVVPGVVQRGGSGGGGSTTIVNHYTIAVPATANPAEVGRQVVAVVQAYERGSGKSWRS